jgi:hypothetical protein
MELWRIKTPELRAEAVDRHQAIPYAQYRSAAIRF